MRRHRHLAAALALTGLGCALGQAPESRGPVIVLGVQDAIGPATSDYIAKGIRYAAEREAALVVLEMDTPGGLDTSMRAIIQAILGSDVPVATFVYPQGARAASAGTYILYASHIAAMAPATNLGAATPVAIGGASPISAPEQSPEPAARPVTQPTSDTDETPADDAARAADEPGAAGDEGAGDEGAGGQRAPAPASASERKAINDAVAYIRSLAEQRGRNADWAERAVRDAASLSAAAAVQMNVVDLVADDLNDLLTQLDGRTIDGRTLELDPETLAIERFEPDWRTQLLAAISNPTVAYMLMLIGIYGLIFEGYNPGAILPGVVGAISLLLALFALQILPVNYAGLALILLGVILMIAEFLVPSFGALGFGGVAAFVFGSLILIDTDVPGFSVAVPLIASIATAGALAMLGTIWLALKSRQRPVVSGIEEMTHQDAQALDDFNEEGDVWTHGERWRARTNRPVRKGQSLKVTAVDGLLLHVEPVD